MFALFLACTVPTDTAGDASELPVLEPPAEGEGFQVSMFGTAPPSTEVWLCSVYDLPTTEPSYVHSVEFLENEGTHHLTLSTTYLAEEPLVPGTYECAELYGQTAAMEDAVMMFGNQGDAEGTLTLPDGVAAMLPAGIQLLHEVHYVNATLEEVPLYSYINGYTMAEADVVDGIWGGSVRDETIEIPAGETKTEWSRCVMNEDVEVQFLASHTHAKGVEFTIAPFDGTTTGEVFYSNKDWHDPMIEQYNPGLVTPAGTGFEWSCTWFNDTDETTHYGLESTDEMCNMAVVFTPFSMTAACEVVETSDGVLWGG